MSILRLLIGMIAVIGFALTLVCCSQAPPVQKSTTPTVNSAALTEFAQPLPTYPPTPTPTITPTPLGGAFAKLGLLPQDCPPGPAPQNLDSNLEPAIGSDPVWAVSFSGPHAMLEWSFTDAQQFHNQYGWGHKMLWVVENNIKGLVSIHGANLNNGLPVRPEAEAASPGSTPTMLVLNPLDPHAHYIDQWVEFPGGLIIPQAGCYYLEADWPGGSWRITFAAGVVRSYT